MRPKNYDVPINLNTLARVGCVCVQRDVCVCVCDATDDESTRLAKHQARCCWGLDSYTRGAARRTVAFICASVRAEAAAAGEHHGGHTSAR